jgi:hypothetical protein
MRLRTAWRIAAAGACSGIMAMDCSPALAARTGSQLGYAITAVGFKSYFVFDTRAGEAVRGTLRVVSLTPRAKTILVAPVDVSTASAGGLQYGSSQPTAEGSWLNLAVRSVRIAGAGSASVPFTARVPRGATAGDHFAGITAVDSRAVRGPTHGRGPIHLRLIPRLAMTLELRVPGRRTSELALRSAKIDVAPSGASLVLGISNPANTLIPASTGSVTVSQGSNLLFSQGIELAAFVPGTTIAYHVPWQGTPVEGTYRLTGELRPTGAPAIAIDRTVTFGRIAIRQFRHQTGRPAKENAGAPVVLIVALAFASMAVIVLGVGYGRARRELARNGELRRNKLNH